MTWWDGYDDDKNRVEGKGSFPGRTYHPSNTRLDLVDFFADRPTYRALGLLIFATIFHRSRVQLHLRSPEGTHLNGVTITDLVIDSQREQEEPYADELVVLPNSYGYWPVSLRELHPLYEATLPRCDALDHLVE